eukprot:m.13725 g.13725  ORF g.13725 m.13725 type:complete len:569 (+) comp25164_c0_seq5:56-1762(+)
MEGSERLDTGLLKDVLSRLRRTVPISHYIRYIKYIHFHLSRLMDSGGKQRYRRIDKSRHFQWHDDFKTVAFQTDEAPRLLIHLGFQEQTNFLVLNEFESNQSFIISLCELATEELTIVKCDPASRLPLLDTTCRSALIAYIAYHYYLQVELLTLHTIPHLLTAFSTDIQLSMVAINSAAQHLGILGEDTGARSLWDNLSGQIVAYIQGKCSRAERIQINSSFQETGDTIIEVIFMLLNVNPRLKQLWFHAQNLQAILGFTFFGSFLNDDAVNTYLGHSSHLRPDCMTGEYLSHLDTSCEILDQSRMHKLDDEQIALLHETVRWQAEHFLTHFRVETFDPLSSSPWQCQRAMDSGVSVDVAGLVKEEHVQCISNQKEGGKELDESYGSSSDVPVEALKLRGDMGTGDLLEELGVELKSAATLDKLKSLKFTIEQEGKRKECLVTKLEREIQELGIEMKGTSSGIVTSALNSGLSEKEEELKWAQRAVRQFEGLRRKALTAMNLASLDRNMIYYCLSETVATQREMNSELLATIVAESVTVMPRDVMLKLGIRNEVEIVRDQLSKYAGKA